MSAMTCEAQILRNVITLQKGKPPAQQPYFGPDAELYLTPEYLRGRASAEPVKPSINAVRVSDGDTIVLWDGSNAGEFFRARSGILASTMSRISHDDTFDKEYFFYVVKSWESYLKGQTSGSGIPHVDKEVLGKLEVFLFDKPEQTKIAEILSMVDRAIEQTEALIAKQQRIKTGLMQDLLTRGIDEHGNLRSEQTHKFKNTRLGRIPLEWEVLSLRDVADYQNGKSFPSSAYRSSGVRLVRPGNLAANGWVVWDDKHTMYLPDSFWVKARDYQVGAVEILMNLTAQSLEDQFLGRVCMTPIGNSCLLNQRLARITAHSCDSNFLYWALKGPHFRDHIDSIPQGTKVQHIYNRNLDAVRLAVPKSLPEQKLLADTLWGIESDADITRKQLFKLQSLKTALMQDLLTGKKRVTALL